MIQGSKIRKLREAFGMTQQELAEKLFVTVQAVSQWENGKTQPDSDRILQLAKILGTTADALLGESSESDVQWQLSDRMFSEEHMYSKLKAFAEAENLPQTYQALPYMRKCHEGQTRDAVRGSNIKIPYIVHPLTMVCHAHAMSIKDDTILATTLLHDVCEDCGVMPEDLPFSDEVRIAVGLLTKSKARFQEIGREAALVEYYDGIRSNKAAMLVKCLDRCHNLSTMGASFSYEKMTAYIIETERDILPLLDEIKQRYIDLNDAAFLLKYQMLSLIETQKALLTGR